MEKYASMSKLPTINNATRNTGKDLQRYALSNGRHSNPKNATDITANMPKFGLLTEFPSIAAEILAGIQSIICGAEPLSLKPRCSKITAGISHNSTTIAK